MRDNGIDRSIAAFATGSLPLSMAVIVDRSFSMRGARLAAARAGALALLEALRADDRVDVLAMGSDVETIAAPDASRDAAREAVRGLTPWGFRRLSMPFARRRGDPRPAGTARDRALYRRRGSRR